MLGMEHSHFQKNIVGRKRATEMIDQKPFAIHSNKLD